MESKIIFELVEIEDVKQISEFIINTCCEVWTIFENDWNILHRATFLNLPKSIYTIIESLKVRLFRGKSCWGDSNNNNNNNNNEIFNRFLNARTNEGFTPLHYASFRGNISVIKLLIKHGADPLAWSGTGLNMWHMAAKGNQPSGIIYFKDKYRFDISSTDNNFDTSLHLAVAWGNDLAVNFLLNLNANPNIQNKNGFTPWHWAVINNRTKILKKLMQYGGDPNIKEYKKNYTCSDMASARKKDQIVKWLRHRGICEIWFFRPNITKSRFNKANIYIFVILHILISASTTTIILPRYNSWIYSSIYFTLTFLTFFIYTILAISNPGIIKQRQKKCLLKVIEDNSYDINNDNSIIISEYCPICSIHKSHSTKHCLVCESCVKGFDHHCFWVGNCIGKGNYLKFLMFLLITNINSAFNIFLSVKCIFFFKSDWMYSENVIPFMLNYDSTGWMYWEITKNIFGCAIGIICVVFMFPIMYLWYIKSDWTCLNRVNCYVNTNAMGYGHDKGK